VLRPGDRIYEHGVLSRRDQPLALLFAHDVDRPSLWLSVQRLAVVGHRELMDVDDRDVWPDERDMRDFVGAAERAAGGSSADDVEVVPGGRHARSHTTDASLEDARKNAVDSRR
jgi:hypothetical protein